MKMTKRDKIIMLSAVLLAVCIIISAVLLTFYAGKNSGRLYPDFIIYIAAVLLAAVLSVAAVYLTKVQKSRYEKLLNASYFKEYEMIKDVIMNSQLSVKSKKETTEDILDILLEAQKAGRAAADVIGDPLEFSKKIIGTFTNPKRFIALSIFDSIIAFVLFVTGVHFILWLEQTDQSFFRIGTDISLVLFIIITAFVIMPVTKKLTSTKNPWMFMVPLGCGLAFVAAVEILRKYFYGIESVKNLLDGTVTMIPHIAVFIIYLISIPVLMKMKSFIRKLPVRGVCG